MDVIQADQLTVFSSYRQPDSFMQISPPQHPEDWTLSLPGGLPGGHPVHLVQSLVISRRDYCNSPLACLPLRPIRPSQLIQNAAARLVFSLPRFIHVSALLRSLQRLPVAARIIFQTLTLAGKAQNGPDPPYFMAAGNIPFVPRALGASSKAQLVPPSLQTHGRQASRPFSVLAPGWWNELPLAVRTADSLAVFKRKLKTHLFLKCLSEH
ncbi:uncharacterized protein LOC118820323 [Colossoma macropomum]|uniref:uncharacterized protein LOC118820323 n=1 Tax=Colossoma macropomum TaxID=42526 RepID=UPI00186547A6|nr:uncharacterized protein LOC118820323 [Colossoma macropomum]